MMGKDSVGASGDRKEYLLGVVEATWKQNVTGTNPSLTPLTKEARLCVVIP